MQIRVEGTLEIQKMFTELLGSGDNSADKAMTVTINETVRGVRNKLTAEIPLVFDRPTPAAKKSIRYETRSISKNKMNASVYVTDYLGADKAIHTQIHGGKRELKTYEKRLLRNNMLPVGKMTRPGPNAPLDMYGNYKPGQLVIMLSKLRAFNDAGYNANATKQDQYHYWTTKHGAFRRKRFTSGYPETLLVYIRQSRSYKKRFDFYGVGQKEADKLLVEKARMALDYALKHYR